LRQGGAAAQGSLRLLTLRHPAAEGHTHSQAYPDAAREAALKLSTTPGQNTFAERQRNLPELLR